ncbi:MAG: hypothetical protein ACOCXH_00975 [Cyclobacteriaceae bacterium]
MSDNLLQTYSLLDYIVEIPRALPRVVFRQTFSLLTAPENNLDPFVQPVCICM